MAQSEVMAVPSDGFGKLAEALLRCGARAIAATVLPISAPWLQVFDELVQTFSRAGWDWFKKLKRSDRTKTLDQLAQYPVEKARAIAREELSDSEMPSEHKELLNNYVAAIPMTARRAITRTNDSGRPKTLLSQLPKDEAEFMRFMPIRPPLFNPGDRVSGYDFELQQLIGQGGFGEVWRAHNVYRPDGKQVALKFCINIKDKASLRREINIYNQLSLEYPHENIVSQILTAFSADPPFLVYEYVNGGDLISWLASFDGRAAPAREVLRILLMCARGLSHAHKHGIVHRDIKPTNILVSRGGAIKITDFGIGAITHKAGNPVESSSSPFKATTMLLGAYTPLYCDPWWTIGETVDAKVDIYALGMIGYQLLMADFTVGVRPDWPYELSQKNVPQTIIDLIGRCVAHPSRRVRDADELLHHLENLRNEGYFYENRQESDFNENTGPIQAGQVGSGKVSGERDMDHEPEEKEIKNEDRPPIAVSQMVNPPEKGLKSKPRTVPVVCAVITALLIWIFIIAVNFN